MTTKPGTIARVTTEAQLQQAVIDLAHTLGYLVHHCRPARDGSGRWSTPIQGDAGFPDLVLVGRGRVVFAELKAESGLLSTEQMGWDLAISRATVGNGRVVCTWWRPSDWRSGAIEEALR